MSAIQSLYFRNIVTVTADTLKEKLRETRLTAHQIDCIKERLTSCLNRVPFMYIGFNILISSFSNNYLLLLFLQCHPIVRDKTTQL